MVHDLWLDSDNHKRWILAHLWTPRWMTFVSSLITMHCNVTLGSSLIILESELGLSLITWNTDPSLTFEITVENALFPLEQLLSLSCMAFFLYYITGHHRFLRVISRYDEICFFFNFGTALISTVHCDLPLVQLLKIRYHTWRPSCGTALICRAWGSTPGTALIMCYITILFWYNNCDYRGIINDGLLLAQLWSLSLSIFFWDSCDHYHYHTWRSSGTAVITITIIHDDLLLGQLWSTSLSYMTIFLWDSCDQLHYHTWRSSSGTDVINFTIIHIDLLLGQPWSTSLSYMTIFFWDSCDHHDFELSNCSSSLDTWSGCFLLQLRTSCLPPTRPIG